MARLEPFLVAALLLGVLAVHLPIVLANKPLWFDESWVAVSARAPLSDQLWITSATPLAFTLLARPLLNLSLDAARLLVIAFAIATTFATYRLTSQLPWTSKSQRIWAGLAGAAAVAFSPTSLLRGSVKQYTAEALVAFMFLAVGRRALIGTRIRSAVACGAIASLATLLSNSAVFVVPAVVAGVIFDRPFADRRFMLKRMAAFGGTWAALVPIILAFTTVGNTTPPLRGYWQDEFLDGPLPSAAGDVVARFGARADLAGFAFPLVAVLLFGVGVRALWLMGRRDLAIAVPLIWLETMGAARLGLFPFANSRTSHFLFALSAWVCALGAIRMVISLRERVSVQSGVVATVLLLGLFVGGSWPYIGFVPIVQDDARSQVNYVREHTAATDVVLINQMGSYASAFYWPDSSPSFHQNPNLETGFGVRFGGRQTVTVVPSSDSAAITEALNNAVELARARGGRVWLVRSHVEPAEARSWHLALSRLDGQNQLIWVGPEPLLLIR